MANITRFDQAFDDLLRGFFVRPVNFEGSVRERVRRLLQVPLDVRDAMVREEPDHASLGAIGPAVGGNADVHRRGVVAQPGQRRDLVTRRSAQLEQLRGRR